MRKPTIYIMVELDEDFTEEDAKLAAKNMLRLAGVKKVQVGCHNIVGQFTEIEHPMIQRALKEGLT